MRAFLAWSGSGVIIAIIGLVVNFFYPELRCKLGLGSENCAEVSQKKLSLTVKSEETNEDLPNVKVRVEGFDDKEVIKTDNKGFVSVKIPSAGRVKVFLSKTGFLDYNENINTNNIQDTSRTIYLTRINIPPPVEPNPLSRNPPEPKANPEDSSVNFRQGDYMDSLGNIYEVAGPAHVGVGRTSYSIRLRTAASSCRPPCTFNGSWTTGAILGHPLQPQLDTQGIINPIYSWGRVTGSPSHYIYTRNGMQYCERADYNRIVGFTQVDDHLNLHGFCNGGGHGNNIENVVFTLILCSTTNPCP
jgi:hypothetical protein